MLASKTLLIVSLLSEAFGFAISNQKAKDSNLSIKLLDCKSARNKQVYYSKNIKPKSSYLNPNPNSQSNSYPIYHQVPLNSNSDPNSKPKPKPKPKPTPTPTSKPKPSPTPTSEYPEQPYPTSAPEEDGFVLDYKSMLEQVNQFRKQNKKAPLAYHPKLNSAAQKHSQDQSDNDNMSHTGSDGSNPGERVDREGYDWRGVAENVAWNQRSVEEVMTAWINSPGHRANLLGDYKHFGLGCRRYYWTQNFATPA